MTLESKLKRTFRKTIQKASYLASLTEVIMGTCCIVETVQNQKYWYAYFIGAVLLFADSVRNYKRALEMTVSNHYKIVKHINK